MWGLQQAPWADANSYKPTSRSSETSIGTPLIGSLRMEVRNLDIIVIRGLDLWRCLISQACEALGLGGFESR